MYMYRRGGHSLSALYLPGQIPKSHVLNQCLFQSFSEQQSPTSYSDTGKTGSLETLVLNVSIGRQPDTSISISEAGQSGTARRWTGK